MSDIDLNSSSDEIEATPIRERKKPAPKSRKLDSSSLGGGGGGGSRSGSKSSISSSSSVTKRNKQVPAGSGKGGGIKKLVLDSVPEDTSIGRMSRHASTPPRPKKVVATGSEPGSVERRWHPAGLPVPGRGQAKRICILEEDEDEPGSVEYTGRTGTRVNFDLGDDSDDGTGNAISEMLSHLGSQLIGRLKTKRRRLKDCLTSVKQCPNELVETLQNHSMERGKVVQKFQEKSNQIVKQVDELFDLQKQTEEKLTKMQLYLVKNFSTMKDSLNACVTGLKDIVQQFDKESSQLQGQHDEETKKQVNKINQELSDLQMKILRDGKKEEFEAMRISMQKI